MKSFLLIPSIAFLLGVISGIWVLPPTPSPSLSDFDRERIMYQLLDELDDEGYSIVDAKSAQTNPKPWYRL
tara:strand:+ start:183 stop:395 length:213 start_codon:yes stop_codon:yes gene_type:complete